MRATRPCPTCGFINTSQSDRCLKCGAQLTEQDIAAWLAETKQPTQAERWFERFMIPLRRRMDHFRDQAEPDMDADFSYRSPWLAGFLAILPGAGALYMNRRARALFFAAVFVALTLLCLFTLRWRFSNYLLGTWVLWILYSMNDAIALAVRSNGQLWPRRRILAMFFALIFSTGALALTTQFLLTPILKFVSIRRDVLEPAFSRGDRVLVWMPGYWFRDPARGEIVLYDPPAYYLEPIVAEDGNLYAADAYLINESMSFERVNGVGGDVVEMRPGGPLLLNGLPMPEAYWPLVPSGMLGNFRIDVPRGKFAVIISHGSMEPFSYGSLGGKSPQPGAPGFIPRGLTEASTVGKKEIMGKVIAVYYPPEHRRWIGLRAPAPAPPATPLPPGTTVAYPGAPPETPQPRLDQWIDNLLSATPTPAPTPGFGQPAPAAQTPVPSGDLAPAPVSGP